MTRYTFSCPIDICGSSEEVTEMLQKIEMFLVQVMLSLSLGMMQPYSEITISGLLPILEQFVQIKNSSTSGDPYVVCSIAVDYNEEKLMKFSIDLSLAFSTPPVPLSLLN